MTRMSIALLLDLEKHNDLCRALGGIAQAAVIALDTIMGTLRGTEGKTCPLSGFSLQCMQPLDMHRGPPSPIDGGLCLLPGITGGHGMPFEMPAARARATRLPEMRIADHTQACLTTCVLICKVLRGLQCGGISDRTETHVSGVLAAVFQSLRQRVVFAAREGADYLPMRPGFGTILSKAHLFQQWTPATALKTVLTRGADKLLGNIPGFAIAGLCDIQRFCHKGDLLS